jgi:hypothetical protein
MATNFLEMLQPPQRLGIHASSQFKVIANLG